MLTTPMPRSIPEAQGIATSAIVNFVSAVEATLDAVHSFMIVRHGHVVAEGWWDPYAATVRHSMYSVSKSFTSTAIGIAISDGLLSLDSTVISLLPDDLPAEISPNLAKMTVRDLLTMTTGHAKDTADRSATIADNHWARYVLAQPVEFEPGTHYVYNSGATYLLSAIIHRLTGERLLDYLTPRILEPLGIVDATWEQSPQGIDFGGWGLSITTEDLATFGQLYLQRGLWNGVQRVPAAWIDEATKFQTYSRIDEENHPDWFVGYGYQFWRCRHDAYRMDGAFGQFAIVFPEQDAVVVFTSGISKAQPLLDLVWEHLLPAFGDDALAAEPPADFSALTLAPVVGAASGPMGSFDLDANAARFTRVALSANSLTLSRGGVDHEIPFGHGTWLRGTATLLTDDPVAIASSGAWTDDHTFVAKTIYYETPFALIATLRFAGETVADGPVANDTVELRLDHNVSFDTTHWVTAHGISFSHET